MGNAARNQIHYDKTYSSRSLTKALIKLYLSYDQLSKTRRNLSAINNDLKSHVSLSVLDYGFGHGTFLCRIPRIHCLSGCELSLKAVRNIKRLFAVFHREITLIQQDDFPLPVHEKKYDLICCSHVLEHVENDMNLLDAFHHGLRDSGRLLLNVPINEVWRDPKHVQEYSSKTIQSKLVSSGFVIESVTESDRWTAYILDKEYVSKSLPKAITRFLRLLLAPLPVALLDRMENVLPEKYRFQQLIVVARKSKPSMGPC